MTDTPETDALIARLLQESDTEVADMTEVDRTVVEFLKQKERAFTAARAEIERLLRIQEEMRDAIKEAYDDNDFTRLHYIAYPVRVVDGVVDKPTYHQDSEGFLAK